MGNVRIRARSIVLTLGAYPNPSCIGLGPSRAVHAPGALSFLLPCAAGIVTIFISLGWQEIEGCFGSPEHVERF